MYKFGYGRAVTTTRFSTLRRQSATQVTFREGEKLTAHLLSKRACYMNLCGMGHAVTGPEDTIMQSSSIFLTQKEQESEEQQVDGVNESPFRSI